MKYSDLAQYIVDAGDNLVYVSDLKTDELYFANTTTINALEKVGVTQWQWQRCTEVIKNGKNRTIDRLQGQKKCQWAEYNETFSKRFLYLAEIIMLEDEECILEIATDITTLHVLEAELLARLKEQDTLYSCIELLAMNEDPHDAAEKALELFASFYGAEKGQIFLINDEETAMKTTLEWCNGGLCPIKVKLHTLPIDVLLDVIGEENVVVCEVLELQETIKRYYPDFVDIEDREGVKLILAPVKNAKGEVHGFIFAYNPQKNWKRVDTIVSVGKFIADFSVKNDFIEGLHKLSYYDVLTGFKNHYSYRQKIKEFEKQRPDTLGVAYIDINGLKSINNSKGHDYGDEIIIRTSKIIGNAFSINSYRVDGNEFVVLYEGVGEVEFEEMVTKMKQEFREDRELSVSVGYSWNRELGESDFIVDENMKKDESTVAYKNFLRQNLMREIDDNRFMVYYQPQVEIEEQKVVGAEALIRKLDSAGNMLPPFFFIPFYEKQGIIPLVDFFVLEEVCKFLYKTQNKELKLSVNFSRVTFSEHNVVKKAKEICERNEVSSEQITIEITETIQSIDATKLIQTMNEFLEAGFTLSLDDFGSGYSNMALITTADFSEIKIDKSLVDGIVDNDKSRVLTQLVISACECFNDTATIAEGIETSEQHELLKTMKCNIGQGYLFDKPLPEDVFIEKYI